MDEEMDSGGQNRWGVTLGPLQAWEEMACRGRRWARWKAYAGQRDPTAAVQVRDVEEERCRRRERGGCRGSLKVSRRRREEEGPGVGMHIHAAGHLVELLVARGTEPGLSRAFCLQSFSFAGVGQFNPNRRQGGLYRGMAVRVGAISVCIGPVSVWTFQRASKQLN